MGPGRQCSGHGGRRQVCRAAVPFPDPAGRLVMLRFYASNFPASSPEKMMLPLRHDETGLIASTEPCGAFLHGRLPPVRSGVRAQEPFPDGGYRTLPRRPGHSAMAQPGTIRKIRMTRTPAFLSGATILISSFRKIDG